MYERVKRLYREDHKLNEAGVLAAVTKGWITEEQAEEIIHGEIAPTDGAENG